MNDLLIYGVKYDLWRDGRYIGQATWRDDENIGDSFCKETPSGEFEVFIADQWRIATKE